MAGGNENNVKLTKTIRVALILTGLFWLSGAAWTLFSGAPLAWLAPDPVRFSQLQPYWDLAFVTVVSGAIFLVLRFLLRGWQAEADQRALLTRRLQEERNVLRAFLDALPDPAFTKDAGGRYVNANKAAIALLKLDDETDLVGRTVDDFYPPSLSEIYRQDDLKVLQGGEALLNVERPGRGPDGETRWYLSSRIPLRNHDGTITGLLGISRDITERKAAELQIRQSEATLAALFDGIGDGILVADTETRRFVRANDAICRMLGYTAEEICRLSVEQIHPREALPRVLAEFALQTSGKKPLVTDLPVLRKDGSVFYADISARRLPLDGWNCAVGVFRDITERKRGEADLRQRQEELQLILDSVPALIFYKDRQHRLLRVNQETVRVTGLAREEMEGKTDEDLGCQMAPQYYADEDEVMATGTPKLGIIEQLETASGIRWMQTDKLPYRNAAGEIIGVVGFAVDITERQRAEAALHQSESRLRAVVDNIEEMIWVAVPGEVRPIYVSPACRKIWGRPEQELVDHPTRGFDSIHPDDRARFLEGVRRQLAGEKTSTEFRIRRPDGTVRWVWDQAFPVTDASGKVTSINGIVADITERKQLEEQLRQAQKMEAIGQLAGGIAHDFNNLLTVIQCNANLLLGGDRAAADETSASVAQILVAAERAADLTRQLLLFSRKQALHTADLDLREIVRNLAGMLRRLVGEDIVLEVDCAADLPLMHGDRTMVEQVLLNLVVNARDAMPRGGRLSLATSLVVHDSAMSAAGAEAGPGTFVRLSVSDTGTGIAPEHRARIFEPFFTTKEVGKGTGLGLATVYGIVKQHRGWIELQSTPGVGTTFHVHFPATERPAMARPAAVAAPPNELPQGDEAILLVEDEPALRALAKRALQRCGYTVHEAASGVAALEVWAAHRDTIKLLLSDMVMPDGLTGLELATRLQAEDPNLKVVLTSGYSPDNLEAAAASFLAKPYSPIKLARIVRDCLDRK